jgi:hypothetical protein
MKIARWIALLVAAAGVLLSVDAMAQLGGGMPVAACAAGAWGRAAERPARSVRPRSSRA